MIIIIIIIIICLLKSIFKTFINNVFEYIYLYLRAIYMKQFVE